MSSDYLAGSININPVLVRKEITQLRKAGYVDSKEGKNGGCFLVKKPETINLAELFKLIYQDSILSFAKNDPNPKCPVGKEMNTHLSNLYVDAEQAMLVKMSKTTLAQFCDKF